MEGMMSMGRMKEDNTVAVATTEANPTHPSGINQTSRLALDMVGQGA